MTVNLLALRFSLSIIIIIIDRLLSSFGSDGDSGDGDDDGSYDGLMDNYMDENGGDAHDRDHDHDHDDKVEVLFVEFLEGYSFVDSSNFSFSS
ncbi:hypothetical protein [Paenibacillus sp. EZ-K15]|uniref:hypothetical protein n=1 Tax=Paenibacillus sp. EZ-K15 TaxID=2044275 RepID=UPI000BF601FB|nr:hypothetical protein [Paenibacillus sp. EZ-K15]